MKSSTHAEQYRISKIGPQINNISIRAQIGIYLWPFSSYLKLTLKLLISDASFSSRLIHTIIVFYKTGETTFSPFPFTKYSLFWPLTSLTITTMSCAD